MQDIILPFYEGFNKFILFPIEPHVSIQKSSKISNLNIPIPRYPNYDFNVVYNKDPERVVYHLVGTETSSDKVLQQHGSVVLPLYTGYVYVALQSKIHQEVSLID